MINTNDVIKFLAQLFYEDIVEILTQKAEAYSDETNDTAIDNL